MSILVSEYGAQGNAIVHDTDWVKLLEDARRKKKYNAVYHDGTFVLKYVLGSV